MVIYEVKTGRMDGKRGSMNMLEVARHENSENEGAESCCVARGGHAKPLEQG